MLACGDAPYETGQGNLPAPISAIAADPSGTGVWMVVTLGNVYSLGSAAFQGDLAGDRLDSPIVAMAADPATGGYWLLGGDGGIFDFGQALFEGSLAEA